MLASWITISFVKPPQAFSMSRRKHVMLNMLQQEVEPPGEGQHIVRAVGSRGSNIMEVEFPEGRRTLCLIPARFHKKLWIKTGTYLIVEDTEDVEERVTGQVLSVLYAEHVKEMKRRDGVWPAGFDGDDAVNAAPAYAASEQGGAALSSAIVEESLHALRLDGAAVEGGEARQPTAADNHNAAAASATASCGLEAAPEQESSSDSDDLPPLTRIQNRRVVEYDLSETDSED